LYEGTFNEPHSFRFGRRAFIRGFAGTRADSCKLQKYGELPITDVGHETDRHRDAQRMPQNSYSIAAISLTHSRTRREKISNQTDPFPGGFYMQGVGGAENVYFGNVKTLP